MADQPGWSERLLVGGPLVLLGVFLCYNVGLRVILTVGVTTPLTDLVGWPFDTTLLDTNSRGWTLLVLGTLPLLWVGGRTLLGRGTRRTSRWATVWAIGLLVHTVGPFFTLLDWGQGYGYFEQLWTVPTQVEAALVSGVLVAVGGIASLWDWTPKQAEPHTGSATRTDDEGATTAADESSRSADRRTVLTTVVPAGVVITLLSNVYLFYRLRPWDGSQQTSPSAVFDSESRSDGRVTIVHAGGDTFTEENTTAVKIKYTDASRAQRTETWGGDGGEFAVAPEDTYTTSKPVEPGSVLQVIWMGGVKRQTVGSVEVSA